MRATGHGPRTFVAGRIVTAIALAGTVWLCGCSESNSNFSIDNAFQKLIKPKRTPQQNALVAFADTDPDARREAIGKVADSKQGERDWAIRSYTTIALLETDSQTRCVAIRALSQSHDPAAAETCLKVVNYRDFPPAEVRPPDDVTRWEAVSALSTMSRAGAVGESSKAPVRESLLERLTLDPDRNVRAAAARGLGKYPDVDVMSALVSALNDDDFSVVYEASLSLQELTGQDFACDAKAWQKWIEEHQDTQFASAGALNPRKPRFENRMDRDWHDTKQVVRWLFPPEKPK